MARKKKISKKNFSRRRDMRERDEGKRFDSRTASKTNDPEWYAQTPALMQDAASIPFSQAVGTSFQINASSNAEGYTTSQKMVIPGIITAGIVPIPAGAISPTSPLNIAATALFTQVRKANSGAANYNSPDLMIYAIAMGNIYSYLNFLIRVYGTVNLYSHSNRYLPRALTIAQGINFTDVQSSLANFRYGVNTLIHKAASLACPASMTYFKRLAFLFSGLYAEGESVKSQLYMYIPQAFLKYEETAEQTGGSLSCAWFGRTGLSEDKLWTTQELIEYGNSLLEPIITSEDMNIMSGDIKKAYGDNLLSLMTLGEDYVVMPTTDLNILEQFQNMDYYAYSETGPTTAMQVGITQSQEGYTPYLNAVFHYPVQTGLSITAVLETNTHLLTTILTQPTAADVMERTRLMTTAIRIGGTDAHIEVTSCTEVVRGVEIWTFNPDTLQLANVPLTRNWLVNPSSADEKKEFDMEILAYQHCLAENFKFHPRLFYYKNVGQEVLAPVYQLVNMAVDVDNYALINRTDLDRMNEAALLSLFTVAPAVYSR